MNIEDTSVLTYWTNVTQYTTLGQSPQPLSNQTSEHVESSAPGNKTWPLTTFIATALSLAVGGVLLPMVAGPIFRATSKFIYRNRNWGRVILILVLLG